MNFFSRVLKVSKQELGYENATMSSIPVSVPRDQPNDGEGWNSVRPFPQGGTGMTEQEILASHHPDICCLPAEWCIRSLSVVLVAWNAINIGVTVQAAEDGLDSYGQLSVGMAAISLTIYLIGFCSSFSCSPRLAFSLFVLIVLDTLAQLGTDAYVVSVLQSDNKSIAAAVLALALNVLLNGACSWCARRYYKILIFDVETWPEMEATQEITDEMNRVAMPAHDSGVPAHNAGFRVVGARSG